MKAVLHTRCGCERKIVVEDDSVDIRLPLKTHNFLKQELLQQVINPTRRFIFHHDDYATDDWGREYLVAHFVEVD